MPRESPTRHSHRRSSTPRTCRSSSYATSPRSVCRGRTKPARLERSLGLPALSRPASGLARHRTQPGAMRTTGDSLSVARRVCDAAGRLGRQTSRAGRRHTRHPPRRGQGLLDFMRRSLAIKVDYLERTAQERMQQLSSQKLKPPWGLDENESLDYATILYPESRTMGITTTARTSTSLRRAGSASTWAAEPRFPACFRHAWPGPSRARHPRLAGGPPGRWPGRDCRPAGQRPADVAGYQVPASAMVWVAGDGTKAFHDPIAVPSLPESGRADQPVLCRFLPHSRR